MYTIKITGQILNKDFEMPPQLQSCHSAVIDGYLIEGHVPESDIARLLKEKPSNISGLAVPGMPQLSPGMARAGVKYENFKVVSFSKNGLALFNQY